MQKQWTLKGFWLICALLAMVPAAMAVQFEAILDKTEGTLEDTFYLTLRLSDSPTNRQPSLPNTIDFKFQYRGQSSQTQIINGKMNSHVDYNYILYPQRQGDLVVPPASVGIQGQIYRTKPIEIRILQTQPAASNERPAYVEAALDQQEYYLGQSGIYTANLSIQSSIETRNLTYELPEMEDFSFKAVSEPRTVRRVYNGKLFEVTTIHFQFFASKVGTQTIPPFVIKGSQVVGRQGNQAYDPFGMLGRSSKPFQLRSPAIRIEVKPLPTQGKPANFKGLIGEFTLKAEWSQTTLKVGDSATLRLELTGNGNPAAFYLPEIKVDESLKLYPDQPQTQTQVQGQKQITQYTQSIALVPSRVGEFQLPTLELPYFNTQSGSWDVLRKELPPVRVTPGEDQDLISVGGTSTNPDKQVVKRLGSDLLPIYQGSDALQDQAPGSRFWLMMAMAMMLGPIGFAAIVMLKSRQSNREVYQRRQQKSKALQKALNAKQALLKDAQNAPFADGISALLKEYAADQFNRTAKALTSKDIAQLLSQSGVPEETVVKVRELLEQCETARFSATPWDEATRREVSDNIDQWLPQVDKILKQKP